MVRPWWVMSKVNPQESMKQSLCYLLTKRLFQSEAPSDGAAVVGDVEGEPTRVHECTHAQAESLHKDAEAGTVIEIAEV
jgi:hypothetical protein